MGISQLINNKRGMGLKEALFSVVIFGFLIYGFVNITQNFDTIYNSDSNLSSSDYDTLAGIENKTSTWRTQITPQDVGSGDNAETATFRGSYGVLASIPTTFDAVVGQKGIINILSDTYFIDSKIENTLIVLFSIALIFALIAIIFRLGRTSA